MEYSKEVVRFGSRDIIKVYFNGSIQGFYRSSGRNSSKKGVFLPFDGILTHSLGFYWFNKRNYVTDTSLSPDLTVPQHLNRFGIDEFKAISDKLGEIKIVEGTNKTAKEINDWLNISYAVDDFTEI